VRGKRAGSTPCQQAVAASLLIALAACNQPPATAQSGGGLDPHPDADFQSAASGCVGQPSLAAAQSLAVAMHANPVAASRAQFPIITYRRDDPAQPGDYIRLDVASDALHQWNFGARDLVLYREQAINPVVVDASSGQVVGSLPHEYVRICVLTIHVANAADHLSTARKLLGGSYAVGFTGSIPSISLATDPFFRVGEDFTFAFPGPLGQGLPMDSANYAVRVLGAGDEVKQPVAGSDMPEMSVSQLQLQDLMSQPASIAFLGAARGPQSSAVTPAPPTPGPSPR
jgi:hypothetical protein